MSTALVEEELRRFLKSSEPEVLCVHGKWGVGKTFIWNALLEAAVAENKVGLGFYSYISLFGITSLDRLKYAIAENLVESQDVGTDRDPEITKSNVVARVAKGIRKSASPIAKIFGGDAFATAFERLAYLSVAKALICIDDLERKRDGLPIRDLLGLVSQLKEQRDCKVILILNDDALGDDDKKEFERLSEKTIDESIEFAPDAEDCARIALKGGAPAKKLLREMVIALGISNIRIIKKIERLISRSKGSVEGLHPRVLRQAVHSLTLLGWSFFDKENAPDLTFLLENRGKYAFDLGDKKDESPDEKRWNDLLDRYEFGTADDFDLALLDGIKRGFFNKDVLKDEAKKLDAMFKASDGEKTLEEAWRPFHNSFDANDDEVVVGGILTALRDNVQRVTPRTLNSIVKLLKDIGKPELAATALKTYVETRQDPADFFDLRKLPFGDDVDDPDVRAAFDEKCRMEKKQQPPADVLLRMAKTDSSSEEDYLVLEKQTPEDFYKLFKDQQGENLSRIVRTAVGFERILGDGHERRKQISARAKEALVRIGKESKLNALRVRKYGIKIDVGEAGAEGS